MIEFVKYATTSVTCSDTTVYYGGVGRVTLGIDVCKAAGSVHFWAAFRPYVPKFATVPASAEMQAELRNYFAHLAELFGDEANWCTEYGRHFVDCGDHGVYELRDMNLSEVARGVLFGLTRRHALSCEALLLRRALLTAVEEAAK